MNTTSDKLLEYKHMGLTDEKKKILKEQMGSITHNIDLNKVQEWWENEID